MPLYDKYAGLAFVFTGLNALCGIIGILILIYLPTNFPYLPLQMLILGAIFDFLDGYIAKRSSIKSSLGVYSDSIGDVITFAILPGIMLLNSPLIGNNSAEFQSLLALIIAGFYSFCAWARLVRFASKPTAIYFDGLPSPAAALLIGSCALLARFSQIDFIFWSNGIPLSLIAIAIGILMILTIKYPTPKRGKTPDMIAIGIAGIVVLIFIFIPNSFTASTILFIALLYTIFGPLYLRKTSQEI